MSKHVALDWYFPIWNERSFLILIIYIGIFRVTSRPGLVGREAATITPPWPGKSVVFTRVGHLPELVFLLLIKKNMFGYMHRGHVSLPDNVNEMKICCKMKKQWHVLYKITAKTCITRLRMVLPTSGPIPRVYWTAGWQNQSSRNYARLISNFDIKKIVSGREICPFEMYPR